MLNSARATVHSVHTIIGMLHLKRFVMVLCRATMKAIDSPQAPMEMVVTEIMVATETMATTEMVATEIMVATETTATTETVATETVAITIRKLAVVTSRV